jgi:hypothetical protein
MIDPERISPTADNVLVRLDIHAEKGERRLASGLYAPDMKAWEYTLAGDDKRAVKTPDANEGQLATVIAAGPGHWHDKWVSIEEGTSQDGRNWFVPMDAGIAPGARVILEDSRVGDRIYDTAHAEYRMVRARNVVAVLEE